MDAVDTLERLATIWGVPTTVVLIFGYLLLTRRFITGSEHERRVSGLVAEIEYRETLRNEERDARVAAEQRLDRALETMRTHSDLMRDIEREVARIQGRFDAAATPPA